MPHSGHQAQEIVTPEVGKKSSKLSTFSRIFKPWKWKRKKKPSEKLVKTAIGKIPPPLPFLPLFILRLQAEVSQTFFFRCRS